MNFIVEGPDCSGKSTLCKMLSQIHHISIHHLTYFSDSKMMKQQFDDAKYFLSRKDFPTILDRYIFSNIVYGNVYHNGEYVENYEHYLKGKEIQEKNCTIIFALPYDRERYIKFFAEKLKERNEMYEDVEMVGLVYDEYENLYNEYKKNLKYNVVRYDMFERDSAYFEFDPDSGQWTLK